MSKLDIVHPPIVLSSLVEANTGRRLIVLVPDAVSDYTPAVHRIWELANAYGARVQFLGLCRDAAEESSLRRQLVTLSALVEDGKVTAEARIEIGTDWVTAVKTDLKSEDTVACFSGQHVGHSNKPLNQILESNLDAPVYVLSGLVTEERQDSSHLKNALAWLGSLGIIIGFFLLQIRIQPAANNWMQTTLLLLSIFIEASLILFWNSLFG